MRFSTFAFATTLPFLTFSTTALADPTPGEPGPVREPAPTPAPAPPQAFGSPGTVVLSSDIGFGGAATFYDAPTDTSIDPTWRVSIAPAADFFFNRGLSLGFTAFYEYTKEASVSRHTFGLGPRLGLNIPLSQRLSLWPRVGIQYWRAFEDIPTQITARQDIGGYSGFTAGDSRTWDGFQLDFYVPLILEPASHFIVGFGPFVAHDLMVQLEGVDQTKTTTLGGRFIVGGWLPL